MIETIRLRLLLWVAEEFETTRNDLVILQERKLKPLLSNPAENNWTPKKGKQIIKNKYLTSLSQKTK